MWRSELKDEDRIIMNYDMGLNEITKISRMGRERDCKSAMVEPKRAKKRNTKV